MTRRNLLLDISLLAVACASAAPVADSDTLDVAEDAVTLDEIVVRSEGVRKMKLSAGNNELITAAELKRAACCNLGESFTTNPSVDVSYSDAATGARQIRLLGLSGSYVQMLTENVPNFRGVAAPYGLGYVAGPWLQSIQVSKGASSVKNGFESITGQINIEMKKPQLYPQLNVNAYADSDGKLEINTDGNLHFGDRLSGGVLLHGENSLTGHDSDNDGFLDMPKVKQLSLLNRWAYMGENHVFQIAAKGLVEKRVSGQDEKHFHKEAGTAEDRPLYKIDIRTKRLELFTKNAFIFDHDNDGNLALILSGSLHDMESSYGLRRYDAFQQEGYASLMFERKWNGLHALSAGLSYLYDNYHQHYRFLPDAEAGMSRRNYHEGVAGAYAQYTLNYEDRVIAMGGIRYDHSSLYGGFVTPRMHLRYNPSDYLSFHASAGSGSRSPHPLAEYSYLLASSRRFELPEHMQMERGWNFGVGLTYDFYVANRKMTLGAEYYYTTFSHQMNVDLDRDPHAAVILSDSRSRSHTAQAELTAEIIPSMTLTAAYRLTDVKVDYGTGYVDKPLTSRHKGLFTWSYAPMMGIWQFDATLSVSGGGRMPSPYMLSDGEMSWNPTYPAYCSLNLQVTRNFRHWSIYAGGENITNYRQKNPIVGVADPWGADFDATMVWGPLHGAMVYVGFRYNITKY